MADTNSNDALSPEDQQRIIKNSRGYKGTWALLIAIAVVFTVARFIMKATAS